MNEIRKVKTAVIGCGMISNIYLRNLKNLFQIIDLVAVCDHKPETAADKARQYGVDKVMTMDEIASCKDIELVVNLTGPAAHYDVIRQMMEAGKNVYTEKMMTTTLEQGRELLMLADDKGLYLGVAPDTVLGAGIQTARGIIDSGLIGDVTSCTACINRNQSLNSETFRFLQRPGGALPYDVGIYYIAALLCLLGPVRRIRGFGAPAPVHTPQLLYQLPEIASSSWQIPGNNLITGTKGILELGDPNTFDGEVKLILPESPACILPMTHGYNGHPVLPDPAPYEYAYGHRGIGVAEMAWSMRMNRPCRCSKEYGYHAMEVLCGLDLAIATDSTYEPVSRFEMKPLKSGFFSSADHGQMRGDAEISLME
jgi:predicted dehydrogenase